MIELEQQLSEQEARTRKSEEQVAEVEQKLKRLRRLRHERVQALLKHGKSTGAEAADCRQQIEALNREKKELESQKAGERVARLRMLISLALCSLQR